jgi:hypothetical protein
VEQKKFEVEHKYELRALCAGRVKTRDASFGAESHARVSDATRGAAFTSPVWSGAMQSAKARARVPADDHVRYTAQVFPHMSAPLRRSWGSGQKSGIR